MSTTQYFARVPFTYMGQSLERGELLVLKGSPRDDQLRALGYFIVFDPNEHSRTLCDDCGKAFAALGFKQSHRRKKGGCLGDSPEITKEETAMLIGADPKKVVVED